MKTRKINLLAMFGLVAGLVFTGCESGDEMTGPKETGTANISATDATVAAENVTGVYLSVKGIMVDAMDNSNDAQLMFESAHEFNLMAYQNGDTYGLGSIELNAGSYSSISFILDESRPGYVQFDDNTTSDLEIEGGDNDYEIMGNFEIVANSQTDLVADIDLRKAFKESSAEGKYMLRTTGRLVSANMAGRISGTVENYQQLKSEMALQGKEAKVVVFAYAEGSFTEAEQEDADGSGVKGRFENAINSAVVAENGSFTLAFMEESEYEIVVGVFEKEESAPDDEAYHFESLIESKLTAAGALNVLLNGLGVTANASTNISIMLGIDS